MEYQIQREGDVAILELHGVLDVASAPTFQTALQSILDEGGNRVAVDMADVSFMDSSGLGVLIAAYRRLSGGGRPDCPGKRRAGRAQGTATHPHRPALQPARHPVRAVADFG